MHMNTLLHNGLRRSQSCHGLMVIRVYHLPQVHAKFAPHYEKGQFLLLCFFLSIYQRDVRNPENLVVTKFNFATRPPIQVILNFKVQGKPGE